MRVKIIKSASPDYWYANMIGRIFRVVVLQDTGKERKLYIVTEQDKCDNDDCYNHFIDFDDTIILDTPHRVTRTIRTIRGL